MLVACKRHLDGDDGGGGSEHWIAIAWAYGSPTDRGAGRGAAGDAAHLARLKMELLESGEDLAVLAHDTAWRAEDDLRVLAEWHGASCRRMGAKAVCRFGKGQLGPEPCRTTLISLCRRRPA